MRLIDSLFGRKVEPATTERAVDQSTIMSAGGWGDPTRERIGNDFVSWSQDGVAGNPIVFAEIGRAHV